MLGEYNEIIYIIEVIKCNNYVWAFKVNKDHIWLLKIIQGHIRLYVL